MSKLYFFRHAQASFLKNNYDQLSSHGEKQSAELGKYLLEKNIRFDKVFVGPLARQQHTYKIVAEVFSTNNIPFPKSFLIDELKEHSGTEAMKVAYPKLVEDVPFIKKLEESSRANPKLIKRNTLLAFQYFMEEWVEGKMDVDGFEPWNIFRKNVKKGLHEILENTGKGETIGVFTSGGTISSITAEALKIQDEKRIGAMNFSVRNTSFSTFLFSKNQFNLLSFNELPHLSDEMITFI